MFDNKSLKRFSDTVLEIKLLTVGIETSKDISHKKEENHQTLTEFTWLYSIHVLISKPEVFKNLQLSDK